MGVLKRKIDNIVGAVLMAGLMVLIGHFGPMVVRELLPLDYYVQVKDLAVGATTDTLIVEMDRWVRDDYPVTVTISVYRKDDGINQLFNLNSDGILQAGRQVYTIDIPTPRPLDPGQYYYANVLFDVDVGQGVRRRLSMLTPFFKVGEQTSCLPKW